VEAGGTTARLIDPLGFGATAVRSDTGWAVPLPPSRVPMPSDPPGFASSGYPVLLVETGVALSSQTAEPPRVTSPLMALAPAVLESPQALPAIARPAPAPAAPAAAAPSAAALPATIQPGPSLVLSVGNPQPGDLLPRGKLVMQGLAFDRAASSGSGIDRVSVFVDDRDAGGQFVGDAVLGKPIDMGFTVTADFSRSVGKHVLFVYAHSAVSGHETVVSFPVVIR
jgi:hypothetical protein